MPEKSHVSKQGGAESGALGDATVTIRNPVPADLQSVIDRWSNLPLAVRRCIVALVKAGE